MAGTRRSGLRRKEPRLSHWVMDALDVGLVGGPGITREGVAQMLINHGVDVNVRISCTDDFDFRLESGLVSIEMLFLILSSSSYGLVHHVGRAMARVNAEPAVVVMTDGVRLGQVYSALGIGASAIVDMDCSGEDLAGLVWLVMEGKRYMSPDVTRYLVDDIAMTLERQDLDVPALSELSNREIEVIHMLCEGLDVGAISDRLKVNTESVEDCRISIYRKCNVGSIVSLMRFAVQNGLVKV